MIMIQINQKAWLKQYIDMNTELRKEAKNDFEKDFFKLMNNAVFGKTFENVRKHRDIKLVLTDKRRSQLSSEPNYHTRKSFSKNLMVIKKKKTKVKMNKLTYPCISILDISKTLMHEFWKFETEQNYATWILTALLYILIFMKIFIFDFYEGTADGVERFDTSNHDGHDKRLLPIENKKAIGIFKNELGGKIMK